MNRVIRYFPDTDLRAGHDMLLSIAKEHKLSLKDLEPGEFVIFVNRRKDALKMFAGSTNLIAYLRLPSGRLDMRTIQMIPQFFNGGEIKYDQALKKVIERSLGSQVTEQ